MKQTTFLYLLFATLAFFGLTNVVPRDTNQTIPNRKYRIDLDLPAIERWRQPMLDNMEKFIAFKDHFASIYNVPNLAYTILNYISKYHPDKEFLEEVNALSELTQTNPGEILLMNYIYELHTFCTSIVFRDVEGKIVHARNLDYGFREYASNLSIEGEFYRGGKLLYRANILTGMLGVTTGARPNAFGITINARKQGRLIFNLYQIFFKKTLPTPYLIRKVLEEEAHFDSAVQRLQSLSQGAPCYYIVSGLNGNEGVVIEHDRNGVHKTYRLDDRVWYLVQTNYDRESPEPSEDSRRIPAQNRIEALGQGNLNESTIFSKVLTLNPNINNTTIITVVISPKTDYYNTTVWA